MRVIETNFASTDALETIQDFMKERDMNDIECLVILALHKDGSQIIKTNKSNGFQKAFLLSFFQAWMASWFRLDVE